MGRSTWLGMDDQDKDQVINTWYNGEALTYTYWGSTGEYRKKKQGQKGEGAGEGDRIQVELGVPNY